MSIFGKIFGSKTGKKLKKIEPLVKSINKLEENFSALSDSELVDLREDFIKRYPVSYTHLTLPTIYSV